MRNNLLLLCLLLAPVVGCVGEGTNLAEQDEIRAALVRGDTARAEQLALLVPPDDPRWAQSRLTLAGIADGRGDTQAALRYFNSIPRDGSADSLTAAIGAAGIEEAAGHLSRAIEDFAYVLEHNPDHLPTRGKIAELYASTGQRWLADTHLTVLVKTDQISFKQLVFLTDFERRHPDELAHLHQCESSAPDDPAVNLGLAVEEAAQADYPAARQRLESVVKTNPELGAAQALLGELLLDAGEDELEQWYDQLPESVQDDPGIWFVRGKWAAQRGRLDIAARCLWETVRQIPTSHRAMYQLGLVMKTVDPAAGQDISRRAADIYELREQLSQALNSQGRNEAAMQRVVELLIESGRDWEAGHWAKMARGTYAGSRWPADILARLPAKADSSRSRIRDALNVAIVHDLSNYPNFDVRLMRSSTDPADGSIRSPPAQVRFENQAAALGIGFEYHQGGIAGIVGVRMFESTGGGIGVIDFDGDGWPDLFLTQGESWPQDSDVPAPTVEDQDRLYRNLGDSFADVTDESRLPEEGGFGQGCSAGDFNNDGFADLYVANIGMNQLLLNNGDGTFTDVTEQLNLAAPAWTTSCLIADLNADGNPDLFDVNYLEGETIFRIVCNENHCSPEAYVEAPDHLHISQGDGTVRFIDRGDTEPGGAGLALIAFRPLAAVDGRASDAAGDGGSFSEPPSRPEEDRLSLFIANDHEPNFFLKNTPAANPENLELADYGYLSGLAVNRDGRKMACMGVASGDVDADGQVDLFVTNYRGEANNLYLQKPGGLFADEIGGTGLQAPGLSYVGWGTQFLDADNDGRLDLVVTNGHVADFHEEGVEYYMPTQFFHNAGGGRFDLLSPEVVGEFFGERILGRSLATLDWNRDGRIDVAISPIAAPVALLTNLTADSGSFLAVRLHAVSSARDAIGAIVTLTTGSDVSRKQLTAGDGYQVTNERLLRFGLGGHDVVGRVDIEWPGGATQHIERIPANTLLDVVEGQPHMTLWQGTTAVAAFGDVIGQE